MVGHLLNHLPLDCVNRSPTLLRMCRFLLALVLALSPALLHAKPNLLIITVDDMSCDSVGAYGCKLADVTPHMDRLAAQSLRFDHAHVVVGNCMPSRNVMWSGRYPHNNGIQGFRSMAKHAKTYPVLGDLVKDAGYFSAIRHKVDHSTPYAPFPWDLDLREEKRDDVKNAASWGRAATRGIDAAKQAKKPFCLLLNIADPHKPFYAEDNRGATIPDENVPSRVFTPEEVPVPGFLPDDPIVRKELAHYYSSVRRADDGVGAILDALKASGEDENTIIVFLSDHGMPLPFAKTQLYHHSSRTPLMIRWPGVTKAGAVDDAHMISTVDLLPTILDMLALPHPAGFDGSSFAAVLRGETQPERTMVFKEHNENAGGQNTPMRAVQTKDWLYIFSPWSNGTRVMTGATNGTSTCRQMRLLAKSNEQIAARIDHFDHRKPEEAYEVRYDPDALTNLIDKTEHTTQVAMLEQAMEAWMVRTGDPLLEVFRHRDDTAFREKYMQSLGEKKSPKAEAKKKEPAQSGLIEIHPPKTISAGQKVVIQVSHHLPSELGEKTLLITLKDGKNGRIKRETLLAKGEGRLEVTFDIPAEVPGGKVIIAGLVGTSIQDALQHLQTQPIRVH